MKSSWRWLFLFLRNLHLMPLSFNQIEKPEIIEVRKILSSKYYKVVSNDLRNMICPLPRPNFEINWLNSFPFFSNPIKGINGIESFLTLPSTCKKYETIVIFIVIKSGIRSWFWDIPRSLIILPLECECTKNPEIVHVVRIYIINEFTSISTKYYQIVSDYAATMTPPFCGFAWIEWLYFVPVQFLHSSEEIKYSCICL